MLIHILPESIANQIAAGEVVERPASVVKELVENAVDAGADRILVEVEQAGKKLIRVVDNGCGMGPEDARLAFERHATSKVTLAADLEGIRSLGFRGEAIPSIVSVARVRLTSSLGEDAAGAEVAAAGGGRPQARACAHARGTAVEVRDLFFNTPARQKFLKGDATETSHITQVVTQQALARPDIQFLLRHNGRQVIDTLVTDQPLYRIAELFGSELTRELIRVEDEEGPYRLQGFVSSPVFTRTHRQTQFSFINGRCIRDKVILHATQLGYSHLLPKGQHPVLFLFLSMDPALMDVNVHPAKAEVRFARQKEVHRFLSQAVRDALRENQKACSLTAGAPGPEQGAAGEGPPGAGSRDPKVHDREGPEAGERAPGTYPSPSAGSPGYAGGPGKHVYGGPAGTARGRPDTAVPSCGDQVPLAEAWGRFVQPGENGEGRGWGPPGGAGLETPPRPVSDLMYSDFEPLGQLDQSFIVLQGKRGLLLVDQHIAHERVLYERFRAAARHRAVEVQSLMFPLAVEFDPAPAALLEAHRERLRDLGLELDAFGPRGFLLRAVPAILKNQDHEAILRDIVRMLGGEVSGHNALDAKFEEIQILMACRNAIKVNHPLGLEQIRKLLHDLENTEMPHTCPHGRPIALLVETGAILKGFHRR